GAPARPAASRSRDDVSQRAESGPPAPREASSQAEPARDASPKSRREAAAVEEPARPRTRAASKPASGAGGSLVARLRQRAGLDGDKPKRTAKARGRKASDAPDPEEQATDPRRPSAPAGAPSADSAADLVPDDD